MKIKDPTLMILTLLMAVLVQQKANLADDENSSSGIYVCGSGHLGYVGILALFFVVVTDI